MLGALHGSPISAAQLLNHSVAKCFPQQVLPTLLAPGAVLLYQAPAAPWDDGGIIYLPPAPAVAKAEDTHNEQQVEEAQMLGTCGSWWQKSAIERRISHIFVLQHMVIMVIFARDYQRVKAWQDLSTIRCQKKDEEGLKGCAF
eukprot:Skav200355  [mRNA]  locus=scaffold2518:3215:3643:- [translate_table: standard]